MILYPLFFHGKGRKNLVWTIQDLNGYFFILKASLAKKTEEKKLFKRLLILCELVKTALRRLIFNYFQLFAVYFRTTFSRLFKRLKSKPTSKMLVFQPNGQ